MVSGSRSGNSLHLACARCRLTLAGAEPAASSFLISSIWVRGWCFAGSCSSATSAVARASVITHSSWPVIPFFGIGHPRVAPRLPCSSSYPSRTGDPIVQTTLVIFQRPARPPRHGSPRRHPGVFALKTRHRPSLPLATPRASREGRSNRRQTLSIFLFAENIVPVILVGLGYRLLTLAHTLLLWCGVRFAFWFGRGFRLGLDNLAFGNRLFRRHVLGFINRHCFSLWGIFRRPCPCHMARTQSLSSSVA